VGCSTWDQMLRDFAKPFSVWSRDVVFCWQDYGFNDGEDAVEYIVCVDFAGDDFFAEFATGGDYFFVRDG
jgi:hypothetical protein